ncbi:uncharacterized protein LOC121736793 isoform X2 [Aricia agestis]|uniref:uncharacterized protein LOC121736793 isoform X2 n=1 Tax=Aricia agestis TaxID=91739 RepID=UPI001C20BE88|nr:uncharacterized protein LOC121736793 isoform X2 [Aricia agestis]
MDLKGFLLSITLLILAFHDHAEASIGRNKDDNYLRNNIAEHSRRFMIPTEEENGNETKNKSRHEVLNNKEYNEIVNKIRLENLEQSLNKEIYVISLYINKILNVPKQCFDELHADEPIPPWIKPKSYFGPLARGKHESDSAKVDVVTKIASLVNLEQSLSTEMYKGNWIINKIMGMARHCYGAEERPIEMKKEEAIINKIYNEITNKTARLEILQLALGSGIHKVKDIINNTVDIIEHCLALEKTRSKNLRRLAIGGVNEKHDDELINYNIYDEIVNKTARLEILRKLLRSKMNKVNSMINKTVDIAEYCFGLEAHRPEIRYKRDVSVVGKDPVVSKNETKTDANSTDGRRSLFRINRERSEIQQKLLNYIFDTYNDIAIKMQALNVTKEQFANDERYAIGYIMANIDTLKVNLANVRNEVVKNKDLWSDMQILDVYDTVIKSNKALSNLHRVLNGLIQKGSKRGISV